MVPNGFTLCLKESMKCTLESGSIFGTVKLKGGGGGVQDLEQLSLKGEAEVFKICDIPYAMCDY